MAWKPAIAAALVTTLLCAAMASAQDTTTGDLAGETTGTGTLPPLPRNTVRAGAVAARAPGTWVDAGVAEFVVRKNLALRQFGGAVYGPELQTPRDIFVLSLLEGAFEALNDTLTELLLLIGTPQNPTVDAGADLTVAPGTLVTLTGTGTDPNFQSLTFAWTQTAGTTVVFELFETQANAATVTFTAPAAAETLTFTLTVTDSAGGSSTDTVNVTVAP